MARLVDVAKLAGVSTATTSRVLNGSGYVSDTLRRRVLAAVQELDYAPDGIARSMSQRRTLTLGLVVSDVTNPFFTAVARGVEDRGQQSGYTVILCNADENISKQEAYLRILREKRVDGVLLAAAGEDVAHVRRAADSGAAIVLIDRTITGLDLPCVKSDDTAGMYEAVNYLLGLGHRRIGIIAGRDEVTTSRDRYRGYAAALRDAGITLDASLVVSGHFTEVGGRNAGFYLWSLSRRPTAIISCNNVMTTGLLTALKELGTHIPDDVSLISFDDLPYFVLVEHPITAIAQAAYEIGQRACDLLLDLITGGTTRDTQIRLPCSLMIRDSCRPIDTLSEDAMSTT